MLAVEINRPHYKLLKLYRFPRIYECLFYAPCLETTTETLYMQSRSQMFGNSEHAATFCSQVFRSFAEVEHLFDTVIGCTSCNLRGEGV